MKLLVILPDRLTVVCVSSNMELRCYCPKCNSTNNVTEFTGYCETPSAMLNILGQNNVCINCFIRVSLYVLNGCFMWSQPNECERSLGCSQHMASVK